MKPTSRGYRQIPLEPVDENSALEAPGTPPAEVDEDTGKDKSSRSPALEVQTLP